MSDGNGPVEAGVPPAKPTRLPPRRRAGARTVSAAKDAPITQIRTGIVGPLEEDENHYYATVVISKADDRLKVATVSWRKEPAESWIARAEDQVPRTIAVTDSSYMLPTISGDTAGCTVNTWAGTSMNAPRGRFNPTAVWTGSEMIVWGGFEFGSGLLFDTGGRYSPSTDTWIATSNNNAPAPRTHHTAVWTGTEMIVWGGFVEDRALNTGGRYDPTTNTWTATSTTNSPYYREYHTAVWTGTEMIIWGGTDGYTQFNTGGRYNPSTDTWTPTSTVNAPEGRRLHTAVWTGSQMIVWGGNGDNNFYDTLNSGGRYNPSTNTWTPTSTVNAPEGRWLHTAVWAGSLMIVWGGDHGNFVQQLNTGGKYNPATNSWSSTSIINAPTHRDSHSAVWSGSDMIIWSGYDGNTDVRTGGRYNPNTNSWTATSTTNAPSARETHAAIWTGAEMIVWGGGADGLWGLSTGGRYNPTINNWVTTNGNAPTARSGHTAVWTGTEMIVWGGEEAAGLPGDLTNTGGRFNPSTDTWTGTAALGAPSARKNHTAVWTGTKMIIWGGYFSENGNEQYLNTGGRYDPATSSWTATNLTNAPSGRDSHTAVWTGSEMIVWGGDSFGGVDPLNTGGRYNPNTNSWVATSLSNAPSARYYHTAVWNGSEMIVWGGTNFIDDLNTGGRYNPVSDSWAPISISNAPSGRENHTAIWTGSEMIVWGGYKYPPGILFNTGGRYNPATDRWTATGISNAPPGRENHTAVWTGNEMIVWGGGDTGSFGVNTGGRYTPNTNGWTATSTTNAPTGREAPTAVWTGSEMIIWGGAFDFVGGTDTGGRYCVHAPPVVTTNPASYLASYSARLNGSVNPGGLSTTVYFQYGTTTNYGYTTSSYSYNGDTTQSGGVNIGGLTASTTYHFRIVATNSLGTSYGSDRTFTALSAIGAPVVTTNAATLVAGFSGTLNGSLDPHGLTTTVYFQYGTTTSYGFTTAAQTQTGNTYRTVSANISGLSAETIYHFRIVAINSAGTRYGSDTIFTTLGPPAVTTSAASYVASSSARLNGTLDPNGLTTTVYFQYGPTTSYGFTTAAQIQTGGTLRTVIANITGLNASTIYHFRIVATNSAGTRYGSDSTFTTLSATGPPVVTTNSATNIATSSATLNGSLDPHGLTTSVYFQYGTTTSYGAATPMQSQTGNSYRNVSANISGLSANTTYHFRVVATNSAGTRYGSDRSFITTF